MIEPVKANGAVCLCCFVEKGSSSCDSPSSLYYIRNGKGLYLRVFPYGSLIHTEFDRDEEFRRAAFCYRHAIIVEDSRKIFADWDKE